MVSRLDTVKTSGRGEQPLAYAPPRTFPHRSLATVPAVGSTQGEAAFGIFWKQQGACQPGKTARCTSTLSYRNTYRWGLRIPYEIKQKEYLRTGGVLLLEFYSLRHETVSERDNAESY